MVKGFTAWVKNDENGFAVTYNSLEGTAWFLIQKGISDGMAVSVEIAGYYSVGNKPVMIMVHNGMDQSDVTCRVFLSGSLVANRTNPEDWAANQADAFTRNLVERKGEDPSYLDASLRDDRSPYPFASKMLRDFSHSSPDECRIKQMFDRMKANNRIAVWHTDYQVK